MPTDLPALTRLTEDLVVAMHAAEERGSTRVRWRGGAAATAVLLALLVPSALAVRAVMTGGNAVHIPGMRGNLPGQTKPTGPAVAIDRGKVNGYSYTFVAQRCGTGSTISVATGFVLGGGGASADPCPAHPKTQPILTTSSSWSPGETWITGVVRDTVTSVDLTIERQRRLRSGRHIAFDRERVRIKTRPLDPQAVAQGNLPHDVRMYVLYRAHRSAVTRAVARNAQGRAIATCAGPCS
jgi:hypothetical protein